MTDQPRSESDEPIEESYLARLGRPHDERDEDADAVDEAEQARDDRRTKVIALGGLATVVVIVAVTILLVRLVDTGSGRPSSPTAAAQQWGHALVTGDHDGRRRLECAGGSDSANVLGLLLAGTDTVHAGRAVPDGPQHWQVRVDFGAVRYSLAVVREQGRYLVC